jgi:hypothetical protein
MKKYTWATPSEAKASISRNCEFGELLWQTRASLLVKQNEIGFQIVAKWSSHIIDDIL